MTSLPFGIRRLATLITVAWALPLTIAFLILPIAQILIHRAAVASDIERRGPSIAAALAQSAYFGVVTGDRAALDVAIGSMMRADETIESIAVCGRDGLMLASLNAAAGCGGEAFEAPIVRAKPDTTPFTALDQVAAAPPLAQEELARVRVVMNRSLLAANTARLLLLTLASYIAMMVLTGSAMRWLMRKALVAIGEIDGAVAQIASHSYDLPAPPPGEDDVSVLRRRLYDAARSLADSEATMTRTLDERTAKLSEANVDKRRLIARLHSVIEDERRRVAGDIHDHLGASLAAVLQRSRMLTALAVRLRNEADPAAANEMAAIASVISDSVHEAYAQARVLVKQLRPETIDMLGLEKAVESLVETFNSSDPSCHFVFACAEPLPTVSSDIAITAYRIVQEALTNIVKHAGARNAEVNLSAGGEPLGLRITVVDDGRGMAEGSGAEVGRETFGLLGMRERVEAIGGTLSIASSDRGTTITATLPIFASV